MALSASAILAGVRRPFSTRLPSSLEASFRPSWMASSRMSFIRIGVPLTADW
ncbi:hypothetical protein D3C76_849940 [compost metagenome]